MYDKLVKFFKTKIQFLFRIADATQLRGENKEGNV